MPSAAATATRSNSAAARSFATAWGSRRRRAGRRVPRPRHHQRRRSSMPPSGSSRPTSASSTGASSASATPAIPWHRQLRRSTWSSARPPRSSPARDASSPPAASTRTSTFICPQQIEDALSSGVTTMLGGGTGPATARTPPPAPPASGTSTACWKRPRQYPMNLGLFRQGELLDCPPAARAGRSRRDWAQTPRGLGHHPRRHRHLPGRGRRTTTCRSPSTPTRSTRPALSRYVAAFKGAPSTPITPRAPAAATPRHHPRLRRGQRAAVVHQPHATLHRQHHRRASGHAHGLPPPRLPHPRGRGLRRIAHPPETIAAEDILHDLGAISMMSSRQRRPWAASARSSPHLADRAQDEGAVRETLPGSPHQAADNFRALRYVAKYTINPAITHGISPRGRLASRSANWRTSSSGNPPFSA
jgi:hypothetical protein